MATLGIPNLCGANPDLENVLGKINGIVDEIIANLNIRIFKNKIIYIFKYLYKLLVQF